MSPEEKKGNWADSLSGLMEKMAPIFDQPILASVRDGFVALMPLIIVGAMVLIILQFPLCFRDEPACYLESALPEAVSTSLWHIFNVTFGLLSLYVVISVSYSLARRRGLDPLMPVFFSFMSYILVATPQLAGGEAGTFLDNTGLFTAIVVSVLSVEVFNFFIKRNLVIKMPEGVPPAITAAFAALIPGFVLAFGWWLIRFILNFDLAQGLFQVLSAVVPVASTYAAAAIAETFHAFLWTMGIHGDLTIGIALEPVWQANLAANAEAVAAGLTPTAIYTGLFRSFVVPGGSGATLPLAIYFTRSKSERLRRVGWLGIPPGIFNINEPITFGAPIIFNPILAIPFIIITFLNTTVAYLATSAGLVRPTYIAAPWTLPSPLLMFLATGYDWRAIIVAILTEFVIPGIIWYPAFKAWEKEVLQREEAAVTATA
ncbi:MAG: PTS sugar transporter subunit IIC [Pelolinea sp.]|nr:PTS sugar transporter subunit IIC [Pelolinea sp.]